MAHRGCRIGCRDRLGARGACDRDRPAGRLDTSSRACCPTPNRLGGRAMGTLTLGIAEFVDGSLGAPRRPCCGGSAVGTVSCPDRQRRRRVRGSRGNSDAGIAGVSNAELWRRDGLDRLTARRVSVERTAEALRTIDKVSAANSAVSVMVESIWSIEGDQIELRVEIEPSRGWLTVWPRVGIRFDLPDGAAPIDGAEWFGLGPLESYPDSLRAARTGRFSSTIRDLSVDYARPQETGHRSQLRQLALTRPEPRCCASWHSRTPADGAPASRSAATPHSRSRKPRRPLRASGFDDEPPDRRRGPARARFTVLWAGCVARVRASP